MPEEGRAPAGHAGESSRVGSKGSGGSAGGGARRASQLLAETGREFVVDVAGNNEFTQFFKMLKNGEVTERNVQEARQSYYQKKEALYFDYHKDAADALKRTNQKLLKIVKNDFFECGVVLAVLVNAVLIGARVSVPAGSASETVLGIMEYILQVVFLVEIVLRSQVFGFKHYYLRQPWHFLDLLIVIVAGAVALWILEPAGLMDFSQLVGFQLLRLLRVARVTHLVKEIPAFRTLWILMQGLIFSKRTIFWTALYLMLFVYMCGVFFHMLVRQSDAYETLPLWLQKNFATLGRTMLTLFQITLADRGFKTIRLVNDSIPGSSLAFLVYIFASIMIMRLVLAIFVENIWRLLMGDEINQALSKTERSNKKHFEQVRAIFWELDSDDDGHISLEELELATLNNELMHKLKLCGLSAEVATEIFHALDDGLHVVPIDNFLKALVQMRTTPKSRETLIMQRSLRDIDRMMNESEEIITSCDNGYAKAADDLQTIADDLSHLANIYRARGGDKLQLSRERLRQKTGSRPPGAAALTIDMSHCTHESDDLEQPQICTTSRGTGRLMKLPESPLVRQATSKTPMNGASLSILDGSKHLDSSKHSFGSSKHKEVSPSALLALADPETCSDEDGDVALVQTKGALFRAALRHMGLLDQGLKTLIGEEKFSKALAQYSASDVVRTQRAFAELCDGLTRGNNGLVTAEALVHALATGSGPLPASSDVIYFEERILAGALDGMPEPVTINAFLAVAADIGISVDMATWVFHQVTLSKPLISVKEFCRSLALAEPCLPLAVLGKVLRTLINAALKRACSGSGGAISEFGLLRLGLLREHAKKIMGRTGKMQSAEDLCWLLLQDKEREGELWQALPAFLSNALMADNNDGSGIEPSASWSLDAFTSSCRAEGIAESDARIAFLLLDLDLDGSMQLQDMSGTRNAAVRVALSVLNVQISLAALGLKAAMSTISVAELKAMSTMSVASVLSLPENETSPNATDDASTVSLTPGVFGQIVNQLVGTVNDRVRRERAKAFFTLHFGRQVPSPREVAVVLVTQHNGFGFGLVPLFIAGLSSLGIGSGIVDRSVFVAALVQQGCPEWVATAVFCQASPEGLQTLPAEHLTRGLSEPGVSAKAPTSLRHELILSIGPSSGDGIRGLVALGFDRQLVGRALPSEQDPFLLLEEGKASWSWEDVAFALAGTSPPSRVDPGTWRQARRLIIAKAVQPLLMRGDASNPRADELAQVFFESLGIPGKVVDGFLAKVVASSPSELLGALAPI